MSCLTDSFICFFFNDTATTEIYTLSLHDALPIFWQRASCAARSRYGALDAQQFRRAAVHALIDLLVSDLIESSQRRLRSEEHTSELQSRQYLVCRLLLEKKKKHTTQFTYLVSHMI